MAPSLSFLFLASSFACTIDMPLPRFPLLEAEDEKKKLKKGKGYAYERHPRIMFDRVYVSERKREIEVYSSK
jgi:hypothetical protein